jgi:hypothetical protein
MKSEVHLGRSAFSSHLRPFQSKYLDFLLPTLVPNKQTALQRHFLVELPSVSLRFSENDRGYGHNKSAQGCGKKHHHRAHN